MGVSYGGYVARIRGWKSNRYVQFVPGLRVITVRELVASLLRALSG